MPDTVGESSSDRFGFGRNWQRFLELLDEPRIVMAERSLLQMLELDDLTGKRFLDIGCGSGLFSLAARRLGAEVLSFDYDPLSVACAKNLRERFFPEDECWRVESGSVLDDGYMESLGHWDVVYSWGVLHHTGDLFGALQNATARVGDTGILFIALYNDQGRASTRWLKVKQWYNRLPSGLRWLVMAPAVVRLWGPTTIRDLLRGRPFATWKQYGESSRGMSPWRDVIDWVGGLPFEVARPEQVFEFLRGRGFSLRRMVTCGGGHGCNEFVLVLDG